MFNTDDQFCRKNSRPMFDIDDECCHRWDRDDNCWHKKDRDDKCCDKKDKDDKCCHKKDKDDKCCHEDKPSMETQTHVHEFEQSTKLAEQGNDRHNHRVAGVTSEVIPIAGGRHVHAILGNTDFLDHHHEIGVTTGPNIPIPNSNKHVHLVSGITTMVDGHFHEFLFTTQIDSPLV